MIRPTRLRRVAAAALAMTALVGLAACGGDDDDSAAGAGDDETTTSTEATTTTMSPEEAEAAVTEVATEFFRLLGEGNQEDAAPLLENGDEYLDELAACEELTKGVTIEMRSVEVNGDTANMSYDILLGGEVVDRPEGFGGPAVFVDGEWLVGETTFLGLYQLAGNCGEDTDDGTDNGEVGTEN